jgi:hypothetical protein
MRHRRHTDPIWTTCARGCTGFWRKRAARKSFHGTLTGFWTIFPHMAGWLPAEEAAQLRFAFDSEMTRLKAA